MSLHVAVSEALFKGLFFMLAGLPCFQTQDLPSFCCTSFFSCIGASYETPVISAVVREDCDGAASSICQVLLELPLASWAEALWGWAVRWFF